MIVYVTRHGQIEFAGDHPVEPLRISSLGKEQARKLGERLRTLEFKGPVFVSPHHRCLETAEIVCQITGTQFYPEPRFGEISGDWITGFTGYRVEEIKERFRRCSPDAAMEWPWWPQGAESDEDVSRRVAPLIRELTGRSDDHVLLVGHGASTAAGVHHLSGVRHGHYNAALSAVELPSRTVLLSNDTEHLGPGEVTQNRQVVA